MVSTEFFMQSTPEELAEAYPRWVRRAIPSGAWDSSQEWEAEAIADAIVRLGVSLGCVYRSRQVLWMTPAPAPSRRPCLSGARGRERGKK